MCGASRLTSFLIIRLQVSTSDSVGLLYGYTSMCRGASMLAGLNIYPSWLLTLVRGSCEHQHECNLEENTLTTTFLGGSYNRWCRKLNPAYWLNLSFRVPHAVSLLQLQLCWFSEATLDLLQCSSGSAVWNLYGLPTRHIRNTGSTSGARIGNGYLQTLVKGISKTVRYKTTQFSKRHSIAYKHPCSMPAALQHKLILYSCNQKASRTG